MGRRKKHLRAVKPVKQCAYSFFLNIYLCVRVCVCVCVKSSQGNISALCWKGKPLQVVEVGAEFYTTLLVSFEGIFQEKSSYSLMCPQ